MTLRLEPEQRKSRAIGNSAQEAVLLQRGIENRRKAVDLLAGASPGFFIILDSPFAITATPGLDLAQRHLEAKKSWAKVNFDSNAVAIVGAVPV